MIQDLKKALLGLIVIGALVSAILLTFINNPSRSVSASVAQGSAYQSTTTPLVGFSSNAMIATTSEGVFGSVIITTVGTGNFTLYDATTSDATKRTNKATTTLAAFPASEPVGTYTFDSIVQYGILGVFNGTQGSTTITYR